MTKHALIMAALLIPVAAQARTHVPSCPVVTEAQVASQFELFNSALATGNPDAVAVLFAPDATLLATVSNAERTTQAAIRDYFVSFLKGAPVGRIDTSRIHIDCKTASRSGTWTFNMNNANGERVDVGARYSFTYKWDGKNWKIQHLHSSVRPPVSQ